MNRVHRVRRLSQRAFGLFPFWEYGGYYKRGTAKREFYNKEKIPLGEKIQDLMFLLQVVDCNKG